MVVDPVPWESIPRIVEDAAARFPGDEAVLGTGLSWTFSDLLAEVQLVARALIASGVEAGDRIAIWAPNSPDWVRIALAVYDVGAVLVPVNTRFRGAEAAFVLRRSRARLLFTVDRFLDLDYLAMLRAEPELPDLVGAISIPGADPARATSLSAFLARADGSSDRERRRRSEQVRPEDVCHILFTSGTTGDPKGVLLRHGQICRAYLAYCQETGIRRGDRYLIVLPFFHSFGLHAGILCSLMVGATIIPEAVFDVPAVVARIRSERVTAFPGPPTIFQGLLEHPGASDGSLDSLRLAVVSAASIPVALVRDMRTRLGIECVITGYGLTEASGIVSMCRFDDDPEIVATTAGRPIPGVWVRIVADDGTEVGAGEPGEVLVRGENIMAGYLDDPERTAEAIDGGGWLHTGDIGVIRPDGNLVITDRKKEMFTVGGFNVSPAEVEKILLGHPDVVQVAVVGVPDSRLGEVPYAFVVPREAALLEEGGLIAWSHEHMANYKVPRHADIVDALPMNATGKVLKYVLRERARAAAAAPVQ